MVAMVVCQRGFLAKMALWLVGLRFKITIGKEKRLSQRVAAW